MDPVLPISIDLTEAPPGQLLRTLHQQLRRAITDGRLQHDFQLPGTRTLARQLGVSRNCVTSAYDLLMSEGYIVGKPGKGTFVSCLSPVLQQRAPVSVAMQLRERMAPYWRDSTAATHMGPSSEFAFDFAVGLPDKSHFPFEVWRRLSARSLRALSKIPASYSEPEGRSVLRSAIAKHVSFVRAVFCEEKDVIVTSGAQQAFNLLAKVFVTPGKTVVAVEDPGYPPLRRAFEAAGAQVVFVPVDSQGIVVDAIPRTATVVCVTPSHQFPMGPSMSVERRNELLAFARRYRSIIMEDDYDGEFAAYDRPLDALQTLDQSQCVFYVGTFSKSLFPELRLGFIVAPEWARCALVAAKQHNDTLAAFILEGHLAKHVRKMRGIYSQRRTILLNALERVLADQVRVIPSQGGLHVTALLNPSQVASEVIRRAVADGVRLSAIEGYTRSPLAPNGLVFGVGMLSQQRISPGILRLAKHLC
jgi:GntR family transcriptional regulator/MocR family aminotransferase